MQTIFLLFFLFTTVIWLMLFVVAVRAFYLWTHANPRLGVVPSAGRSAPAVVNTQRCRQNSVPRKLARHRGERTRHNVRSQRGGPEPYRYADESLKYEDFYTENDHRQGAYARVDNGISTRECPGQRSGYDRIILIVDCENAARGRTIQRRRD